MRGKTVRICCTINSIQKTIDIPAQITALQLLRDILKLKGTKEGCGIGECGACTIQVDGKAVNSCLMLAAQLDGRNVVTIEGLGDTEKLHPLQESFLNNHAVQCGFCTPGLIMSAKALLDEDPSPSRAQISKAVAGNLCRCTGYQQILSSIQDAIQGDHGEKHND
jgi:aerobic carbon-monoxide dehydrogenase small subunit